MSNELGPPWCFGCNGPPCAACGCALCLVARQAVAREAERRLLAKLRAVPPKDLAAPLFRLSNQDRACLGTQDEAEIVRDELLKRIEE